MLSAGEFFEVDPVELESSDVLTVKHKLDDCVEDLDLSIQTKGSLVALISSELSTLYFNPDSEHLIQCRNRLAYDCGKIIREDGGNKALALDFERRIEEAFQRQN